jgi:hypothetical protein
VGELFDGYFALKPEVTNAASQTTQEIKPDNKE